MLAGCSGEMASTEDSGAYPQRQVMPVDPVGIRPIPAIPTAMHGCWWTDAPTDPEEPGAAFQVVIDAWSITQTFEGAAPIVATAQFVEKVTPTSIEGRFTAPEGEHRATVATSLILGPDEQMGLRAGTLRIAEGDAGSYHLERCDRLEP